MTESEIEQYLAKEQEETTAALWGIEVTFKPYLLKKIYGDGMKLIYFGDLDDRPYWWLVRVDSNADIDTIDHEEIYEQIEEECGFNADNDPDFDEDNQLPYPAIQSYSSPHWGLLADLAKGVDRLGFKLKY